MRAVHLYCELVSGAVLDGLQAEQSASDPGARVNPPTEAIPEAKPEPAGEAPAA
jgi:small subunit ribosomal protein S2